MKLRKLQLFLILSAFLSLSSKGQLLSAKGKEFWTSFTAFNLPSVDRIFVYITSEKSCTGYLENTGAGFRKDFTVSPGTPTVIEVPLPFFYTYEPEVIKSLGLHVMATDSISVFAENFDGFGLSEVATIFPINSLGSDYMVLSYNNTAVQNISPLFSEFMVVGIEDNTLVQITPTQPSSLGTPAAAFTITLDRGQTYLYKATDRYDVTGSEIHVVGDCKKVAVFSGAQIVRFGDSWGANHLFEQSFPLNTLGTQFLLTPTLTQTKDLVRILASQNNTGVYINNVLKAVIGKGQVFEQEIMEPLIVRTSRPAMAALMGVGDRSTEGKARSSAFMLYATPVEQLIGSFSFATIDDSPNIEMINFLNVHVRTAYSNQTLLDGKNIGSRFTVFPADPTYSYARIELESGAHSLANINGFSAYAYGYGKKTYNGYGMAIGSSLNKSNQFIMVNGISSNLQKEFYFCPLQAVKFEAIRQDTLYSKVHWLFSDGGEESGDVVTKNFADTGCYTVQMISVYTGSSGNCLLGGNATDTTTIHVCVKPKIPLSLGMDIYNCIGSTVVLQPKTPVPPGFNYLWSDGTNTADITVNNGGTYWLQIQNGECKAIDSIDVVVQGTLQVNLGTDRFICVGDSVLINNSVNDPEVSYSWSNGVTGFSQYVKEPGNYTLTATRKDCRSAGTVKVGLLKCPGIYVPSAFTPNNDGRNDMIRPIMAGIKLDYFKVYSRWGQLVFQTATPMAGWDGLFNGQPQANGVYIYTVNATDDAGKKITKNGTFVLLR